MGDLLIAYYVYNKVMSNSNIKNKFFSYFIRLFFIIGSITGVILAVILVYCTYNSNAYNQLAPWQYVVCFCLWIVINIAYICFSWWIINNKKEK